MSAAGHIVLKPSAESFADWARASYAYLAVNSGFSLTLELQAIYNIAINYNPAGLPPVDPLLGVPLWQAMSLYIGEAAHHRTVLQTGAPGTWPELRTHIPAMREYYIKQAAYLEAVAEGARPKPPVPPRYALEATRLYLHVLPPGDRPSDWRIGLNVKPQSRAKAIELLAPLIGLHDAIREIKFEGPQSVLKPDAVIVYLQRDDSYPEIEAAVLARAEQLELEPRVGASWDEIAPGIGVAAEPPMGGTFLRYRCLALQRAFYSYTRAAEAPSTEGFMGFLHDTILPFGIDTEAPHRQGPLLRDTPGFGVTYRNMGKLSAQWR